MTNQHNGQASAGLLLFCESRTNELDLSPVLWGMMVVPTRFAIAAILFAVTACADHKSGPTEAELAASDAAAAATDAAYGAAAAATAAALASPIPAMPPPLPVRNYDARDGLIYSYIAAISEDQRKAGKAAGDVVSFAYLGIRNGKHVLAQVDHEGSIIGYSACAKPCAIITNSNGSQVAYNEGSIIGSAFADALAGRLRIAEEISPRREPAPSPSLPQSNRPNPAPVYKEPSAEPTYAPLPASTDEAEQLKRCATGLGC